ncbi:MAG: ATP-binding protein [Proteobacteria bacterium]|nr:ATP-binding protein [Pseudomonadota bacterium]
MAATNLRKLKKSPEKAPEDPESLLHFVENLKRQWVETIDALPDPFIIVNSDYKINKANAAMAEIAGVDVKSIIGSNCYKVFAGRSSPCENCHMQTARGSSTPEIYEIRNRHNNRWYEVVSKSLGSNLQSEGVLQIYRDRTENILLQHQVAQQEKLASIGQLAGGFAHEINNPLGGIIVFAQMLLREVETTSPHYQDIVEIESAAQRCKSIVEGMLDFARKRPVRRTLEPTNFHSAIESAVRFAGVGHNTAGKFDIISELDAKIYEGMGDRNRIIQVILNLCTNALQAMRKSGTLTVRTSNSKKGANTFLDVFVSDTGTGIKRENLKKIFDPFFTTKEPGQGTGLGLSIVHGIVQDLGGTIEVDSKVNQGTTFHILFIPHNFPDGFSKHSQSKLNGN